jgi:type IV pilus assembly protein PilM
MAQRILGIDIGSWSIKATVVESSLRRSTLVAYREHHLPADATGQPLPGELRAAIQATLQGLDYDSVVSQVPAAQALTRELDLPFSDPKRIAQILPFQLESVVPKPLDTLAYDYQLLDKRTDGAKILCAAVDKAWLRDWLGRIGAAGVQPRTLTVGPMALDNILPHLDAGPPSLDGPGGAIAVVDLGHRGTTVSVFRQDRLVAFRTLARGGHHLTQALMRELDVTWADAEGLKHRAVTVDEVELAAQSDERVRRFSRIVAGALDPLLRDLRVSLDALGARSGAIGELILAGGGSRLAGIDAAIAAATDLPVRFAAPRGSIWSPETAAIDGVASQGLLAAALALEPLTADDRHRVDLRKGEFAYGSDFDAVRSRLGWMIGFAVLLLIGHFVRQAVEISELSKQQAKLSERLNEHMEKIGEKDFGAELEVPERFAMALELIQVPPADETREIYPGMTAFAAFYEATRVQQEVNDGLLPDEIFDDENMPKPDRPPIAELKQVELQSFNTDGKSLTITGTGFDIDVIEAFKSKLGELPCFKQVERQETRATSNRDRPNWRDFTLKAELKCELAPPGEKTAANRPPEEKK